MNQESGWGVTVEVETVGNTPVLGHPLPRMGFSAKTGGLFVEEKFS